MARSYEESERVATIAKALIKKHHPHLKGASIAYVMKHVEEGSDKTPKPGREGKHPKVATARAVPKLYLLLTGNDFVIEVDEFYWNFLSVEQQEAIVDHELTHCSRDEDGWYIRDHDVQEFRSILERHGFYMPNLEEFVAAAQPHLPFDGPKGAGGEARGVH